MSDENDMNSIGVVVIGRNEGERLKTCIRSLADYALSIVYVDSGSTDGSVAFVTEQGFDVVELDMSLPFSAGRARNEGYRYLLAQYPNIEFIQFVDGDCEICAGWIERAYQYLTQNTSLASVCGRRKERYPEQSVYNQLCDIEWNTPVGKAMATGGDFMCRKQALVDVGGFAPHVIAGEEPEMCFRMRAKGWEIERIDADMTLHDAAMTELSQLWKRYERSGHAYAQGFALHGDSEEKYYRTDVLRIVLWALFIPVVIVCSTFFLGWLALCLVGVYPVKVLQIFMKENANRESRVAFVYAASLVLGKFPQFKGAVTYWYKLMLGKQPKIIEYKR